MATILKLPKNWTQDEQIAFAKGERPAKSSDADIIAYFSEALELGENATLSDVKTALLESNGVDASEVGTYDPETDGPAGETNDSANTTESETTTTDTSTESNATADSSSDNTSSVTDSDQSDGQTTTTDDASASTNGSASADTSDAGGETVDSANPSEENGTEATTEPDTAEQTTPDNDETVSGDGSGGDTREPFDGGNSTGSRDAFERQDPTEIAISDFFAEYDKEMKPGHAHLGGEGPSHQRRLYRTIQTILRLEGSRFNKFFTRLLDFVNERRDEHFHETYAFRYLDSAKVGLTSTELKNFTRFLNLLITTCDPATRSRAVEQVDLEQVMLGFRDPEIYQKVVAYYSGQGM